MAGRRIPDPKESVLRQLFAAQQRCAYPDCPITSVAVDEHGSRTILTEVAHIEPASPGGPRANSATDLTDAAAIERLRGFDNLVLLCGPHHKLVDSNPDDYSMETLTKWKLAATVDHPIAGTTVELTRSELKTLTEALHDSRQNRATLVMGWIASFLAVFAFLPAVPGFPSRSWGLLTGSAVIATALIVLHQIYLAEEPILQISERPVPATAGSLAAIAAAVALVVATAPSDNDAWYDGIEEDTSIVVVARFVTDSDDAAQRSDDLQTNLVNAINNAGVDGLIAVEIDDQLAAPGLAAWEAAQPIDVDVVVGGMLSTSATAGDTFRLDLNMLAGAATRPGVAPLTIDESFGLQDLTIIGSQVEKELVDSRLLALVDTAVGVGHLSLDQVSQARDAFGTAQAKFTGETDGDARFAPSPLIAGLAAFAAVVDASQTGDFSQLANAEANLVAIPGVDRSPLALSTSWSLRYLQLLPTDGIPPQGLGPCIPPPPSSLPDAEALDGLRNELLKTLDPPSQDELLAASARALLVRVELWRLLVGTGTEFATVQGLLDEQVRALSGQPELGLRLWESDARYFLGQLERGAGRPFDAVVDLQQAQLTASPFYRQAILAEIGHVLECDFVNDPGGLTATGLGDPSEAQGLAVRFGLSEHALRSGAACYYDLVSSSADPFPLEVGRQVLASECDRTEPAIWVLCLFDQAIASVSGADATELTAKRTAFVDALPGSLDPTQTCPG